MTKHVMLDLETWGTANNAVIVSIGAVAFDAETIIDKFHIGIEPESCERYGLKIDASTVLWWMSSDRREALARWDALEKADLASVLEGFAMWCDDEGGDVVLWGNGATFDNVILRSAYAATGLEYPAKFWNDRCYRTLKGLAPEIKLERVGTHHDALDDAESQARHLQAVVKHLGAQL